jgi:hypothetical protein
MTVVIDATTLTELVSSVQAMLDYPAGLSCTTAQSPIAAGALFTQTALAGNPNKDYAVGGGQATIVHRCEPEETNFGLSAHVNNGSMIDGIGGSVNFTIPQCTLANGNSYSGSHLGMTVDCLQVTGSVANLTAAVTEKTGVFAAEFPTVNEIAVQVIDNTLLGDRIGWEFQTPALGAIAPCDFQATADRSLDHGNVTVHDAP